MTLIALPQTPAELLNHLMTDHGWTVQGWHSSLMASHRIAHGDKLPPQRRPQVGHDHLFPRAFGKRLKSR